METKQPPTMLVVIPSLADIKTPTVHSMFAANNLIDIPARIKFHTGAYIHKSRNDAVQEAIDGGFDYLMLIDSDMEFPANGINKLLEDDKDIVGGLYFRRQPPHLPTINEVEGDRLYVPLLDKYPKDKLFSPFSVATGFLLIKRKVLLGIKAPWFGFGDYHSQPMGEDVYFCWKARKHKFEVWCDPRIELGHIGEYSYSRKDYDAYRDQLDDREPGDFNGQL